METEAWVNHQQAIWKVLPLHPQPQPLESLVSYITRLAEANGLQSIHELRALAGGMTVKRLKSLDYPALPYSGLAQITGYPEERWLDMTFFHLAGHFGRSIHPNPLHRFLQRSLAPSLRYCPICLASHTPAYYSLLWRFLALPGCSEHGVCLLNHCSHCGSSLPLWRSLPRLKECPLCQRDLSTCEPPLLSGDEVALTDRRTNDLRMLLSPGQFHLEKEQAKLIGKRFQFLRQRRGLLTAEVASLMSQEPSIILDIDFVRGFRPAGLDNYMQYADILGYSLCEIFDETSLQELLVPLSEEQLLDQATAAIHHLKTRGKPVLPRSVGDLMGMTARRLKEYPRLNKLINRCETERKLLQLDAGREEELIKQIEHTLKQLEARGKPIVLQHVCDLVGLSYSWLVKHPRIKALFSQYQKNRSGYGRSHHVDEKERVQRIQAAVSLLISHGETVTIKRIRQISGVTQKQVGRSPRLKALLAQYTGKKVGEAS